MPIQGVMRRPSGDGTAGPRPSLRAFLADERGATMIEYALLGSLMAVMLVASVSPLAEALMPMLGDANEGLRSVAAAPE